MTKIDLLLHVVGIIIIGIHTVPLRKTEPLYELLTEMNYQLTSMTEQGVLTKPFQYEITTTKGLLTGSKHMSYQWTSMSTLFCAVF